MKKIKGKSSLPINLHKRGPLALHDKQQLQRFRLCHLSTTANSRTCVCARWIFPAAPPGAARRQRPGLPASSIIHPRSDLLLPSTNLLSSRRRCGRASPPRWRRDAAAEAHPDGQAQDCSSVPSFSPPMPSPGLPQEGCRRMGGGSEGVNAGAGKLLLSPPPCPQPPAGVA